MKSQPLFNRRKRRSNRSQIPPLELVCSLLIVSGLVLILSWVIAQRSNYSQEDRDLPDAFLDTGIVTAELYHPPLQRWSEKAAGSMNIKPNLGLLPPEILNNSWQVSLPLKEFNADTLFEKINGEADKFLTQGFKNLQFIRIENTVQTDELGIELYDQGDLKGSLGVFAEYVSTESKVQNQKSVVYILNSAGAVGRKGRFFFRLVGNRESPTIVKKAEEIMKMLESLPQAQSEIPVEYKILASKLGINPAFISFQSKNVFQFAFARNFWFGSPTPGSTGRVFIHHTESEKTGNELFSKIVEEQKVDYKILKQTGSFAVMQHLFLKTWFVIRLEGPIIFGVEKMKDVNMAQRFIRQTSDILANESGIEQQ